MENVTCKFVNEKEVICNGIKFDEVEDVLTIYTTMFWVYLGTYLFLVLFAGLMSGLTMGLLSLDKTQLEILMKVGKGKEKKYAEKIFPIVKKHHLLLVTLLLANAVAVETMPIFMDKITNPIIAIVVSVTAVLIFGEIIPQALCTRYGLAIGYYLSPFVKILMVLLFILSWPISKLLDCMLGSNHTTFFRRAELKELVNLHQQFDEENEEPLSIDEALIIKGALDLKDKTAKDAMVPIDVVFMLETKQPLDLENMNIIIEAGHSRIPVYRDLKENIVGLLLVKTIITLDPDDSIPIENVMRPHKLLLQFYEDEPLYNILNACQTGRSHMCLVKKKLDGSDYDPVTGIITLEDVIEEILQEEIVDETDQYIDVVKRIQVARILRRVSKSQNPSLQASVSCKNVPAVVVTDEKTPLIE